MVNAEQTSRRGVGGPMPAWLSLRRAALAALVLSAVLGLGVALHSALFAASSVGPGWRPAGLQGMVVHQIALDHRTARPVFAATDKGVFLHNASRWRLVLAAPDVWSVLLLANDHTVLAAENAGYVDISADRGQHWQRVFVAAQGVFALTARPGDPAVVLAGAANGMYRSVDGGHHWIIGKRLRNTATDAFAWQPGSNQVVFAGNVWGGSGGNIDVMESDDVGSHWHVFGRGLHSLAGIMSITITRDGTVLAGTMGNAVWAASLQAGVWRKMAAGMPPTHDHGAGLITIPGKPESAFVGTLGFGVFRTRNGGASWQPFSTGLSSTHGANVVLSLAYAHRTHTVYATTADGVYMRHA